MFPYADQNEDYWTGYFSSRANQKIFIRDGQASLHSASKLYSIKSIEVNASKAELYENEEKAQHMLDAMGIYQHHDAATGTAK